MAKNNALINRYKMLYKKIDQVAPEIYAAIALSLHRKHGWGFKRINDLFVESEEVWNECVNSDINMIDMCEAETGIEVRKRVNG